MAATLRAAITRRSGQSWQPLPPARRITPPSKESSVSRVCPSSGQIRGGGSGEAHMSDNMLANWLSLGGKLPRSPVTAGFRKPRAQAKTEGQAMPTARGRGPGRPHGSFRPQSHARRGADEVRHCPRSSHAVQWARSQALGRREGSSSPKRDFSAARHAMSDLGPAWSSALDRTVQRGSPPVTLGYSQP